MKNADIIALLEQGETITKQEYIKFSRGKIVRGKNYIRYKINNTVISSTSFYKLLTEGVIIKTPTQQEWTDTLIGQIYILNPKYAETKSNIQQKGKMPAVIQTRMEYS